MTVTSTSMRTALADATPSSFWLDSPERPAPLPPLDADTTCALAVVGGGYTGLWTALLAKEADPSRDVLLLEARTIGWAASGRNGGFCAASLTHGLGNGRDRFPDELAALDRLGRENLDAIEATVARYGIDCGFERTGEIVVAVEPHQVELAARGGRGSARPRPRQRLPRPRRRARRGRLADLPGRRVAP